MAGKGTACAKALWYRGAGTFKDPKGLCGEHAKSIAGFPNSYCKSLKYFRWRDDMIRGLLPFYPNL